jgi:K+-transporting ATPase A subunit
MRLARAKGIRALGVGLAVLTATGLTVLPADAATLQVNEFCGSTNSKFECFATVSGNTGALLYSWSSSASWAVITTSTTAQSVDGVCTPSHPLGAVRVVVTDSIGQTGSAGGSGICNRGFP